MFILITIALGLLAYALANRVSPKNWWSRLGIFYLFWLIALLIEFGIFALTDPEAIRFELTGFTNLASVYGVPHALWYEVHAAIINIIPLFAYWTIGFFLIEGLRWAFSQFKRG